MKRTLAWLLGIFVVLLAIAACAAPSGGATGGATTSTTATSSKAVTETVASTTTTSSTSSGKPLKVVLFVNGVLGDKSFFDSAQRGVDRAKKELGIEAKTIEAGTDPTQWESALTDAAANEDYDVFITGSFQVIEYLQKVAPEHKDKKFFTFDAPADYANCDCGNIYSISYKQNEGSYLAGVYAAAMTTQKLDGMNPDAVIGSIGGQEIPVIVDFMVGYEQGAKSVNPDIKIIRQFAGGWNDPAKGKELAKAQYSQGADIVFQIAGGTGQGVFEAAAEDGKWAIGVDSDQATIIEDANPKQAARILTSMMKNVDNSLFRGLKMHLEGTTPYGKAEALGLAEGGVSLARNKYYDENTPDAVKKLVDEAEQKIIKGEVKVETAFK